MNAVLRDSCTNVEMPKGFTAALIFSVFAVLNLPQFVGTSTLFCLEFVLTHNAAFYFAFKES